MVPNWHLRLAEPRAKPALRSRRRSPAEARPAGPAAGAADRRTKKRIARGNHAIDGRLDLHGMTQAEAHDALFDFCAPSRCAAPRSCW
jgi:DNA-nicking Smr family endonuclease